ncbi:MAG: gamma-glutamylcyclotransferase [Acidobacteriota bacterium]|nr:gamma-glutamylcyclotransferase [Acidobacteriota bacterium]
MTPQHIFLYGTLHPQHAPAEVRDYARQLLHVGAATVSGTLYHLGEYPALLAYGSHRVPGTVFALPAAPRDEPLLRAFDRYEDYRPLDHPGSLYLRVAMQAILADHTAVLCWVYLYNQPLPSAAQLLSR